MIFFVFRKMNRNYLTFCAAFAVLFITIKAESHSKSCVSINGKETCTEKSDPNGNMAGAAAVFHGGQGAVGAGAGTHDKFDTDIKNIGN